MPSTAKNNSKEPLIRIYSTPKLKKRMKPRRLTMPANLRNPQKNVDEIVKRYSMQLEAKEADEKLSEECLVFNFIILKILESLPFKNFF